MYLRCLDFLVESVNTPLDQPTPEAKTFGEKMVEALLKVALSGDPAAARVVFDMLTSHDETLANADFNDDED
jgi:hypothetical protein